VTGGAAAIHLRFARSKVPNSTLMLVQQQPTARSNSREMDHIPQSFQGVIINANCHAGPGWVHGPVGCLCHIGRLRAFAATRQASLAPTCSPPPNPLFGNRQNERSAGLSSRHRRFYLVFMHPNANEAACARWLKIGAGLGSAACGHTYDARISRGLCASCTSRGCRYCTT
jgi:hypothetical protein